MFGIFAFNHFTSGDDKNKDKDKIAVVVESSTYKVQKDELNKLLPSAKITIGSKDDFDKLHKQVEEGDLDGLFHVTEKGGLHRLHICIMDFQAKQLLQLWQDI